MMYSLEKLEIWEIGMAIVNETYSITKQFSREEIFGLTSQMRRAATSIPLNIAEGSSRTSKKDFRLFLRRSIGSIIELITALKIAIAQEYTNREKSERLNDLLQEEYFKIIAFEKGIMRIS